MHPAVAGSPPKTAQLAMSADEITEYCRRATLFPDLSRSGGATVKFYRD